MRMNPSLRMDGPAGDVLCTEQSNRKKEIMAYTKSYGKITDTLQNVKNMEHNEQVLLVQLFSAIEISQN